MSFIRQFCNTRKLGFNFLRLSFLVNTLIFIAIGSRYVIAMLPIELPYSHLGGYVLLWAFLAITHIGHFALLAFLMSFLVPLIALIINPSHRLLRIISWIMCIFSITLLLIDSQLFYLYRFHLNATLIDMVFDRRVNHIFGLSFSEWTLVIIGLIVIASITIALMNKLWGIAVKKSFKRKFRYAAIGMIICIFISYSLVFVSLVNNRNELSQQTIAYPFYDELYSRLLPTRSRDATLAQFGQTLFTQPKQPQRKMYYPQQALQCQPQHKLNVLLLVVDSWRADMVNPTVMPWLAQWSQQQWQFQQHYSGGNASKAGLFSVFFSIPSHYWDSARQSNAGPILFKAFQNAGYQVNAFMGAKEVLPGALETIFQDIPDHIVIAQGNNPGERDQYLVNQFSEFLKQPDARKPFFSFLYLVSPHSYCQPQNFAQPFQPAVKHCQRMLLNNSSDPFPYMNRYKNAVQYTDGLLKQVISIIKQKNLDKNTIIIFTSDHGQEFNDNQKNYWEHASNFTDVQTKVPLIIHMPKHKAMQFSHKTSHYDIAPTLLRSVLGCENTISDYSSGKDLRDNASWESLLIGSYVNVAVRYSDRYVVLYPSGRFSVYDLQANKRFDEQPNKASIAYAINELRRFYIMKKATKHD